MRPLILTALPIIFTACSDASLKTFNADPTATINSHSDGDEILEKESYLLFGKVADTDHEATELRVNWYVNSEPACEDLTPEDDGSTECLATLGTGAMNILLEVSDPGNKSGNDSVALTINPSTPPEVNLVSPFDGDRYRAEEPIEFRGYVMDEEEGIELEVWLESSIQGVLDITPALDAEGDFSTYSTLIEGDHVITLSAQDSSGKVGEDSHLIEVLPANGAPSISSVEITPDPATAEDALTCTYTGFSDPDGDEDASSYAWTINGDDAGTGDSLSGGYVRGDEVTCTVTPSDGDVDGDPVSDTLIIDNSQPTIDAVEITPDPATISDILTCTYTGFADADSDDDASSYAWTINGVDAGDSDTLEGGYVGGDEVTCTVTPSDGTDDGDPLSDTIIIDNTGPEVTSVEVTPDSGITTSTALTCNATATDPDGGTPSISYAWDIDGTSGGTGDSLDLSGTSAVSGQTVTCTATARDDAGETALGTDSVLIENSPPAVDSITLSPTEVYTNDTITATISSSDPEGDAVSLTYAWYVNSSLVSETGSTLDGVSYFDKHDEVDLVVTPSDGTETGDAMTSETITVLNTAPTAPEVNVSREFEESRVEIGGTSGSATMDPAYLYADVIRATEDAVLHSFDVYGYFTGCSSVDYYVLSSPTAASGTWTIEWENLGQTWSGTPDYQNSGDVGLDIEAGRYYALTYGANCSGGLVFYYGLSGLPTDGGFGEVTGYFGQTYAGASSFSGAVTYYGTGGTQGMAVNYSVDSSTGCEDGWTAMPDGNRCAQAFAGPNDWEEAQDNCESHGGNLVRISSTEDNDFVADLYEDLTGDSWLHIGLNDRATEGDWVWVDGGALTYTNWDTGRPDIEAEDCVEMVSGFWGDTMCSGTSYTGHVCQTSSTSGLVCTIVTESTDDDGDAIDYTFDWDVEGSVYTDTETTTWDDDTVPGDALGSDETWTCEVTPNDGEDNGDPGSDSYYIEEESTVCTADLEFSVDGYVVHTYAHELDSLPSSLNPHYYINAATWAGHANMDLDDLLVSDSDSGATLISNDFSSGSGWGFSSGGSGSASVSGGQGHATADWNGLTLSTSTPPVAHLEYTTAIRPASSSGRLLYDLLDETADAWLRVHLCPRPDSMACAAGDASAVGMDPSMGWVCSKVGDSESGCESIPSSPWTTGAWQDVTVSIDFSSACGL